MFRRVDHGFHQITSSCVYDYNFCVQCFRKFFQRHVIQKNLLITFQHAAWDQKLLSKVKTGKLLFQILPCDQTGHRDLFTEKTILDGCDRNLHIGIFLLIFSALFISHISVGGTFLSTKYYPTEIADLISGIIIYLCAFSMLFRGKIQKLLFKNADKTNVNAEPAPAEKANAKKEGK